MNKQVSSKASLHLRIRGLIAGTQKHFPNESLTFGGAVHSPAELIQTLQSLDDATTTMDTVRAKWQDALKTQRDVRAKVGPVIRAYRSFLVSRFGKAVESLADFGITPRKAPMPQTVQDKATAVAKRAATRTARHTLGPRAKADIKGTVTTPAPAGAVSPSPAKPA